MYPENPSRTNRVWLLLIPLLLLATGLAARSLMTDALWYDEFVSLYRVGSPPYQHYSLVDVWNFNLVDNRFEPPGYYLMLSSWGAFLGWTHYADRSLSLLAGVLALAMTYRLGRDLFSTTVGLSAAAVLTGSAFFIDYLHELRSYTIFAFLTAFILWAYWRIVQRRAGRRLQAGFVIAIGVYLYLHYYTTVPLMAIALYHLIFVPKKREWWRVVILMGLGGLLFLPWIGTALQGFLKASGGTNYVIPIFTPQQTIEVLLHAFSNGSVPLLLLIGGIALGIRTRAAGYIWFCTLAIIGLMLLVNTRLHMLIHIRHLMAVWPLLAVIVGLGIARLAKGGIHPAWPMLVWLVVGITTIFNPNFIEHLPNTEPHMDWQGVNTTLTTLQAQATQKDVVIFHVPAGTRLLGYYMHDIAAPFKRTESFVGSPTDDYTTNAHDFMAEAANVWYVTAPDMPPFYQRDEFMAALTQEHVYCDSPVDLPGMQLARYVRIPDTTGGYQFGEGITLTLLDSLPEHVTNSLPVLLGWSLADDVPRQVYSAALHVEDANGQLVKQVDYGLPPDSFGCVASAIGLDGLPAGDYTLLVAVYAWETGERLPAIQVNTQQEGDRLPMGTFRID